jgi:hypothetical protein
MNPNYTDIFGRLDRLTGKVRNLLSRVKVLEGSTAKPGGSTVDSEGNLIGIENTTAIPVTSGGTHMIPDFSGMLLVNDHYDGGVELWIAGSGDTVLISHTRQGFLVTNTLEISGNGYLWTNNDNLTGPFTFTVVKTRNGS